MQIEIIDCIIILKTKTTLKNTNGFFRPALLDSNILSYMVLYFYKIVDVFVEHT